MRLPTQLRSAHNFQAIDAIETYFNRLHSFMKRADEFAKTFGFGLVCAWGRKSANQQGGGNFKGYYTGKVVELDPNLYPNDIAIGGTSVTSIERLGQFLDMVKKIPPDLKEMHRALYVSGLEAHFWPY